MWTLAASSETSPMVGALFLAVLAFAYAVGKLSRIGRRHRRARLFRRPVIHPATQGPRRFPERMQAEMFVAAGGCCRRCGQPVHWTYRCDRVNGCRRCAHADHIRPYSKGGTTTLDNGQILCASCNLSKGARWHRPILTRGLRHR